MAGGIWGSSLPRAYQGTASGLALAVGSLGALADILASLDAGDDAAEARAVAIELAPLLERVKALRGIVETMTPILADREVDENRQRNAERVARERAESIERFARMSPATER